MRTRIDHAQLIDGTGGAALSGSLWLEDARIVAIGQAPENTGVDEVIDASGLVLAPGFIDILSHSTASLLHDGNSFSKITQGVTSEIMGEGWTPAPTSPRIVQPFLHEQPPEVWQQRAKQWRRISDWLEAMVMHGVSVNVGAFLGGGTLRAFVKGFEATPATESELEQMQAIAAQAMKDGAFGVSYARIYAPDCYASQEEISQICHVVKAHNGVFASHIRNESSRICHAIDETLEIASQTKVSTHIYHLKVAGENNWGKILPVLHKLENARKKGIDVTADMYPYAAAGTYLSAILPPWVFQNGAWKENLARHREGIRQQILYPSGTWEDLYSITGAAHIVPVGLKRLAWFNGQSLEQIAKQRQQAPLDCALDLLLEEEDEVFSFYFDMSQQNLELQIQQPFVMVASDGEGTDSQWDKQLTHPRAYGTFTRVLGRYVREKQLLSLEQAIHKMTGLPAKRLGMADRGLLRVGAYADLVLLDPAEVMDHATFLQPHRVSTGIRDVWVNGIRVLENGKHTNAKAGRALYGRGKEGV